MKKKFEMTNLEKRHHFLGIDVHQGKKGIFVSQEKYANDI